MGQFSSVVGQEVGLVGQIPHQCLCYYMSWLSHSSIMSSSDTPFDELKIHSSNGVWNQEGVIWKGAIDSEIKKTAFLL